jgi:hypothetical protein
VATRLRLFAGAAAVLAIIPAFLWWPVCAEQLSSTGRVVEVCRDMSITDPPVVVLGVLALALFSGFYAEISGFGFTLRRKVEELGESVSDLTEFNRERVAPRLATAETLETTSAGQVPDPRIAALAERYDRLRWTMPSGDARTGRMTDVVEQMRDLLRHATDFDLTGHLEHHDRGVRLAAYAYLRAHTVPGMMPELVAAAAREDKPFGQYCALLAVVHQRDSGVPLSDRDRATLRAMRANADTSRGHLIKSLLDG